MNTGTSNPTFDELIATAARGQMSALELIGAAQQLSDHGEHEQSIALYQQWLGSSSSPLQYAARFNLATLLVAVGKISEAEQIYWQVIKEKPDFENAYTHLSVLLDNQGRNDEAIRLLQRSGLASLIEESNRRIIANATAPTFEHGNVSSVLLEQGESGLTDFQSEETDAKLPLVSILIPTHNRPGYFEMALRSALQQTYGNIEIVVSDNSDDELTYERITPYLIDKRIVYHREPGLSALDNFAKCIELSTGEYVNFLMDDDIFHPDKIRRMMHYFLRRPSIGLVTSFRQLIDGDGNFLPPANPTERLFPIDTLIQGQAFGEFILKSGRNVLGEPTTVLVRRADIAPRFGMYFGRQFVVLADVAAWLSILANKDCVYIADALSYFRIHPGQDQKNSNMKVHATLDWFRLFLISHRNGAFLKDRPSFHEMLAQKLLALTSYVSTHHADLRNEIYNQREIKQIIADATEELLSP